MTVSSIFFNGRTTSIPGSYSEVDASGLEVVGLGATGIVAIVGEVEGGSPWNGATPYHRITNPGAVRRTFREGDIVEASAFAFSPSPDPAIPGGAAEVIAVKVNPSTRSTLTFPDAVASDSLVLTSADYGLFTTQINVSISTGTNKGKAIDIVLGDIVEAYDDVGGDTVWTTTYTLGAAPVSTMTIALDNTTGVTGLWTRADTGLDGDITAVAPGAEAVQAVSANAADTTQTATIYGLDGSGDPQTEVLALNGTTPVVGTATWSKVLGVVLSAATAGNITIASNPTTATVIFTITAATTDAGVVLLDNAAVGVGNALSAVASAASTADIVIFGFAGLTAKGEKITLNGTTPVPGTDVDWTEVTVIALGDLAAATTVTVSGTAFALAPAGYPTVKEVVAYINDLTGWVASIPGVPGANPGALLIADMDEVAAVTATSAVNFLGDLAFILDKLNSESALVTAAKASGANAPPANTAAPAYLSGGVEGATAFADWQGAFDVLRDVFVSTIVVLTSDEAVHAAALAHAVYMGGPGKKERDVCVGGPSGVTKTLAQADVVALNSRHVRYCFQDIERFNTDGAREVFPPYFLGAIVAGAQAGSPIGESLTSKFMRVLDVTQDSTIVLQDQANELINSGMWFLEPVQGVGFRCLRNVTTHLIDSNLAFTEASVNEAVNVAAFNLRTGLEAAVGRKGFQATINQMVSTAVEILSSLVDDEILTSWRNLTITLTGDVLEVDVEIAPVIPINFVKTTLHLVSASFAAAA